MTIPLGNLRTLRSALANGVTTPLRLADAALANANQNPSHNTYLWQDAAWTHAEAERAEQMPAGEGGAFGDGWDTLWGLPIAVKDCFDLAGAPTTCGTKFYAERNGVAERDSWVVERLRRVGAVITGKTHLHPLAYGITGENPEFGDCLQPGKEGLLTGGSSSGSCAAVMEGSAVAAIGTDTGGSIRVPAALCGLAGYRASVHRGDWRGGSHLSRLFDTLGWLFGDLEEAPLLGSFLARGETAQVRAYGRFAVVGDGFLHDCEPEVMQGYREVIADLEALGLRATTVNVDWWNEATEIFAALQAVDAAAVHHGNFEHFQGAIRERLEWGSRITPSEQVRFANRHGEFSLRMDALFREHELIVLPAAPVARLEAGADHSQTRGRLLRYTAPVSLAGAPAVTIPCPVGGVQMAAAREQDESLLQVAALLGAKRKASGPVLNG